MPGRNSRSLVQEVCQMIMIARQSSAPAERFAVMYQKTVLVSRHGELGLLNAFWRDQLSALDVDTISAREALCPSDSNDVWLDNFREYVLPLIVEFNLPQEL